MFHTLLVAYDGSMESRQALKAAVELALKFNSDVHVLTVIDDLPKFATTVGEVKLSLSQATKRIEQQQALASTIAKDRGVDIKLVIQPGKKVDTIINYVLKNNCDGLLVGFKSSSGFLRSFKISTALEIASRAPCHTVLVRTSG